MRHEREEDRLRRPPAVEHPRVGVATSLDPSPTRWWRREHRLPDTPERRTFQRRSLGDPAPPACAQAARWWPLASSGRPHRQKREEGGRGRQGRRRSSTRKRQESILERWEVGKHMKGTPANGPPCDLNKACSVGERLGLMVPSTRRPWTGSVALRCHPWRGRPGSMSSSHRNCSGRTPAANSCQEGAWNPSAARCSPEARNPGHVERRVSSMEGVHYSSTDGGVPLLHHLQTFCPARPVSGSREQCGASEAQTAKRQWQAG